MKTLLITAVLLSITPASAYFAESNFGQVFQQCINIQRDGNYAVSVSEARIFCTAFAQSCAAHRFRNAKACTASINRGEFY